MEVACKLRAATATCVMDLLIEIDVHVKHYMSPG